MQRAAFVGGTLGLGTALVFAAAALAASLFPNGGTVNVGWNGVMMEKGAPVPIAVPAGGGRIDVGGGVVIDPGVPEK